VNREVCKFLSGSFAALGYAHAAYAVATSRGIINEPVFLGRRWGVGYMWTEATVYTALSLALGYMGWASPQQHRPEASSLHAIDTQATQSAAAAEKAPA
jgi:hypothetical protein